MLGGRDGRATEVGTDEVTLIVRSIPLRPQGDRSGALLLVRDVTELRSRDRELVTKDVTIREIHHRVKNNLQTVAALLRLQARRTQAEDAKAALEEAVRRVGSIAIVHETLSHARRGDRRLRRDRRPARRDGGRRQRRRGAGPGRARGVLRQAPLRGGHAAGDGADRAAAERRRARLRRPDVRRAHRGAGRGHRAPHRRAAARGRRGRRARAARRLRPRRVDPARASRSCARSSSPSSAASSRSGPGAGARACRRTCRSTSRAPARVRRCGCGRGRCGASARDARPR